MNLKIKKIGNILFAIFLFLGLVQSEAISTKAVTGTMQLQAHNNWNYKTNDPNYTTWGNYSQISVSGQTVFCVDPRTDAVHGATVTESTPAAAGISDATAKRLSLIQYFGMRLGTPDDYAITSSMIWNTLGSPDWISSPTAPTWASLQGYFNQINTKITRYKTKPSINGGSYTINVGESITLTDTNGVLSDYNVAATGGLSVTKSGNSLIITALSTSNDNATITLNNNVSAALSKTNTVFKAPGVQSAGSFYAADPIRANIAFKVNKFGSMKIAKKDTENHFVPDTTFRLSYNADMSDPIGEYTTGDDGTVQIDELMGTKTVYYQEIAVPANLVIDKTIRSIVIVPNDVVEVTNTNTIQKGRITLKKEDKDTGSKPQGESTLTGAVYGLYAKTDIIDPVSKTVLIKKDSKVAERTTAADGSMDAIDNLYLGNYYLKEDSAPVGYLLDSTEYDASLDYDGDTVELVVKDIIVKDTVINGNVQITKVAEIDPDNSEINDPEPGAEFTVVLKKYVDQYGSIEAAYNHRAEFSNREYDLLVTDDEGIAISKKLAYGTYLIKQTKAGDDNLKVLDQTFEAKIYTPEQKTIKYVISNQKFTSYLQLIKKDADNGKTVTLSSASFKIFDVDNDKYLTQRVGMDRIDTWHTDKKGIATLPLKLSAGHYRLEEVKAPEGYLINKETVDFEITSTHVSIVDKENQPITIVEMKDAKPTGDIELLKTDKDTGGALAGVQYQFTAAADVLDPADGTVIYKQGDLIAVNGNTSGIYTTNSTGEISITDLPLGSYSIQESKALDGYVKDDHVYTFVLEQENDKQTAYIHTQELKNQKTKFSFMKYDEEGFELIGAELSLIDKDNIVIDSWTSGNKPHMLEGLKVGESYTLTENNAPDGFVKAKDVTFTVKNTEEVQKIEMTDIQVTALKLDVEGKPLSGAKLQVVSGVTKNVVDQWISDGNPHAISGLLEDESYVLQELKAPNGYVIATEIPFTAEKEKKAQVVPMTDKKVNVLKTDYDEKPLEGAIMQVVSDQDKAVIDQWVTDGNVHSVNGLKEGENYILRELEAPSGYVKAKDISFSVDGSKETKEINMKDKQVTALKIDEDGKTLSGAKLQVVSGVTKNIVDQWTSDGNPHAISGLLEDESYVLQELKAPVGLKKADDIKFTVDDETAVQSLEMSDDYILTKIQVNKVDVYTKKPIKSKDFEFTAYKDSDCKDPLVTVNANTENGTAIFKLRYGEWWIKETKAPVGYMLSDEVKHVEIKEDGVFVNEQKIKAEDTVYSFIYENELLPMIKTGDDSNTFILWALVISSLCIAAYAIKRKKSIK